MSDARSWNPRARRFAASTAVACMAWGAASSAYAEGLPEADFGLSYTADVMAAIAGVAHGDDAVLDNLLFTMTVGLERQTGLRGARFYVSALNNAGGAPNDYAGTLQGVDNIEVSKQGARLYQAWFEADVAGANWRAGLYDLNSEFYVNDSAGLLLAPPFGVGSELAATGVNGPAIFPSTAVALRVRVPLSEQLALKFAVVDAHAGTLGDPTGIDLSLQDGALLISELTWSGDVHASVGGWTYSDPQPDIRNAGAEHRAAGAYLTLERQIWGDEASVRAGTAFVRLGVSDGDTTPYEGGWQAGLLVNRLFSARPDSQASIGVYQGRLGFKQRANLRDEGVRAASAETGIEFTLSDQLTPQLRLQPDLQLILDPAGDRDRENVWVAGLRIVITPLEH